MSILLRFFTLITIAAAGFALPMSCAQTSAAAPVTVDIPAVQHIDVATPEPPLDHIGATLAQHLSETLPLDCGDGATPSASEHPATFDTQPFVPGYLVSTIQLDEETTDFFAPPPALIQIDSRAGPPDAPPPKSID